MVYSSDRSPKTALISDYVLDINPMEGHEDVAIEQTLYSYRVEWQLNGITAYEVVRKQLPNGTGNRPLRHINSALLQLLI